MNDELECPNCSVLIYVSDMELYKMIICDDCGAQLEYVEDELILVE